MLLSYYYYFTVRLVNGFTKYEGKVEVYHNGEWDAVCDYSWELNDAQVMCKELGFGNAVAATQGFYEHRGSFWRVNLQCVGTELNFGSCLIRSGWTRIYRGSCRSTNVKCASGM